MTIVARTISRESLGADLVRLVASAIIFAHGFYRLTHGQVAGLAEVIADQGIPLSLPIAYLITLNETFGMPLIAFRFLVFPVCLAQCVVFISGIVLFHRHNGFFIVGAGGGGWEYNALLIACFAATLWENRNRRLW